MKCGAVIDNILKAGHRTIKIKDRIDRQVGCWLAGWAHGPGRLVAGWGYGRGCVCVRVFISFRQWLDIHVAYVI